MTAPTPIEELNVKPKLCRDCVWFECGELNTSKCHAPANSRPNLVTGGTEPRYTYCVTARLAGFDCGPDAKWFVALRGPAVNGAELVSDPRVTVEMDDACSKSAELREGLSEENAI